MYQAVSDHFKMAENLSLFYYVLKRKGPQVKASILLEF